MRYYKGLAWYRQALDVPAEFAGKRVFLWCGGVDEKAKVWVNGKVIGVSHGAAFYPLNSTPPRPFARAATVLYCCDTFLY